MLIEWYRMPLYTIQIDGLFLFYGFRYDLFDVDQATSAVNGITGEENIKRLFFYSNC